MRWNEWNGITLWLSVFITKIYMKYKAISWSWLIYFRCVEDMYQREVSGFCKRIGFVKADSDTDTENQMLALHWLQQHQICITKSRHVA
jgi:hypothetical protein